jgi:hypothetical protein
MYHPIKPHPAENIVNASPIMDRHLAKRESRPTGQVRQSIALQ